MTKKRVSIVNFNRASALCGRDARRYYAAYLDDGTICAGYSRGPSRKPLRRYTEKVMLRCHSRKEFKMGWTLSTI